MDPVRGIFKCFKCDEGGDVFAFVMKHHGLDFPSAIRHVGERVGIEVPEFDSAREDPWALIREATAFASEWFAEQLLDERTGAIGREYLARRGIPEEWWSTFGIGLAPGGWRGLIEAARARGIAAEPYDRFRDRLMFTIHDVRDRPIGFGGRALTAGDTGAKYINSPESPIFHKRETLFGLNRARHPMRREGYGLIGEGFLDVIALHVHGFDTAVATLGTSFTPDQAGLISRYAGKAYLLYDSDSAGLKATFRTGDALLAVGVHPMVVSLPPGEDPDSVLRTGGRDALEALMSDAIDILDRKLQILERHGYLESTEGKRRAVDGLLSTLRAVKDPALRDLYLGRAAEATGVRRETLVAEVTRSEESSRPPRVSVPSSPAEAEESAALPTAERTLLVLLLRDPTLIPAAESEGLTADHFRHAGLRRIYEATRLAHGAELEEGAASITDEDEELRQVLARSPEELGPSSQVFDETVRRLVFRSQIERLGHIDRQLQLADETQARSLLVEKSEIAGELRRAGVSLSFLRNYARSEEPTTGIIAER